mmetsp:Transcript_30903/g.63105  ORF Transcript_30903/g.63105 Transcript_30903/m.63105 type:complete len:108 (+) Transcript_30903:98-421(+)
MHCPFAAKIPTVFSLGKPPQSYIILSIPHNFRLNRTGGSDMHDPHSHPTAESWHGPPNIYVTVDIFIPSTSTLPGRAYRSMDLLNSVTSSGLISTTPSPASFPMASS